MNLTRSLPVPSFRMITRSPLATGHEVEVDED